jgi:hypothetical protein
LISGTRQKYAQNFRPDAAPLHRWHHVERAEVDRPVFNLLLNPTHILFVGDDDPDFLNFEEPSEVPLLPRLIPAEKAFDHYTHGLEIEVAGEDEVFTARCSKRNLHYSLLCGILHFLKIAGKVIECKGDISTVWEASA